MTFDFTANFSMFSFLINALTITPKPNINIYGHQIKTKHTWKFQPKLLFKVESSKKITCNVFIFSVHKTCVLSFFLSSEPLLSLFVFMLSVAAKTKDKNKNKTIKKTPPHPIWRYCEILKCFLRERFLHFKSFVIKMWQTPERVRTTPVTYGKKRYL